MTSSSSLKDLLSSLPKQEGIFEPGIYQYQGFWYSPIGVQGVVDFQQHFQAHKNAVFLATCPKSGTTWLKAIFYALINRETCPPQDPNHPLLKTPPHNPVPSLEFLKPSEYDLIFNYSNSSTRLFAFHFPTVILPKSVIDEGKVVYLCRDIKDTFVSLFHFSNKASVRPSSISLEKAFDLFNKGLSPSGPVWDHILGYWKESLERPDKVLFIRYEDMINDPRVQLRRLAHFLEKPFSQEEENSGLLDEIIKLCSFDSMSKLEVNNTGNLNGIGNESFFRSGVVGGWKSYLTPDMASKLDHITEEKFCGSGLSFT